MDFEVSSTQHIGTKPLTCPTLVLRTKQLEGANSKEQHYAAPYCHSCETLCSLLGGDVANKHNFLGFSYISFHTSFFIQHYTLNEYLLLLTLRSKFPSKKVHLSIILHPLIFKHSKHQDIEKHNESLCEYSSFGHRITWSLSKLHTDADFFLVLNNTTRKLF